jgi:hypothetical protein
MPKTIPDITYEENTCHRNWGVSSSSFWSAPLALPAPPSPVKERINRLLNTANSGTEIPVQLNVGDEVYAYSNYYNTWFDAVIIGLEDGKNLGVVFKTTEHPIDNKETYYTKRVRYNVDAEISNARAEFFKRFPKK